MRATYGLGLFVTAVAFLAVWRSMPVAPEGRSAHVDPAGALVLAGGLFLGLFLASQTSLWSHHLAVAASLATVAVLLLCAWTASELHSKTPLSDVRAIRHPAVAGANIAMFVAARSNLAEPFAAIGLLGFGVCGSSAAMPGVILAVTPKSETSSTMTFNYVVRSVGYSLGSAIGQRHRAAPTSPGRWSASAPRRSRR